MPIRVKFRFNIVSGEVEEFIVDDQNRQLPEAEHDRIAAEVARVVAIDAPIDPVEDDEAVAAQPPQLNQPNEGLIHDDELADAQS